MRRVLVVAGLVVAALIPAAPAAAGGGCHDPRRTEGTGTTVDMRRQCFKPTVLSVAQGTTVTFANRDEVEHVLSGGGFHELVTVAAGDELERRFDEPGTYAYMCHLHPGMSGAVVVGEPALASSAQATGGEDGGLSLVPIVLALVAGVAGGVIVGRRRVASTG